MAGMIDPIGGLPAHLPSSDIDLYSDQALMNPVEPYRQLRDLGSSVWLDKAGAWFIGRYADVHAALNDWESFSSAKGIGLNPVINHAWSQALICTDPPLHTERRRLFGSALGPWLPERNLSTRSLCVSSVVMRP